jgi:hypothetical protein
MSSHSFIFYYVDAIGYFVCCVGLSPVYGERNTLLRGARSQSQIWPRTAF